MKKVFAVAVTMLLMAGMVSAAPELVYDTSTYSFCTYVTAQEAGDPSTQYWKMAISVDPGYDGAGAIWQFSDLSGNSDSDFVYACRFITSDPGLFQHAGAVDLDGNVDAMAGLTMGTNAMTYTVSKTYYQGSATAVFNSAFTINTPVATAAGYTTNITIDESFCFSADWVGGDQGWVQAHPTVHLYASEGDGSGNEWTGSAYNGHPDGLNYQTATATVTGDDPLMAAGSTFTLTNTWPDGMGNGEDGYDEASTGYGFAGGTDKDYFELYTANGVSGLDYGNPGPAGSERTFTSTTELDISIIPEPATMGLLGLGLLGVMLRRRKK